ncbi:MAG: hypothetical protein RIE73_27245 [Coleofasciculus sp. C1-SOL-03]|uniref:hypothetical protein n=1 Tax=Coleofasciculus sp. C1-SOL-03 TaxID=3069522 RepID=UPI003303E61C
MIYSKRQKAEGRRQKAEGRRVLRSIDSPEPFKKVLTLGRKLYIFAELCIVEEDRKNE